MKKSTLLTTLAVFLLCACSSSGSSSYDEEIPQDPYPISEEKQREITNAFYQQAFVEKGIMDDSAFCGEYEPRLITLNSFMPYLNYGIYDNNSTYVLTFAINGFCADAIDLMDVDITVTGGILSFIYFGRGYYGNIVTEHLLPQVYKNGRIYDIVTAFNNGIVGREVFTKSTGKRVCLNQKGFHINEFNKKYFTNLPPLRDYPDTTYSLLTEEYETIKQKIYIKEFVDKGITDDSLFRDKMDEYTYGKHSTTKITEHSVHLDNRFDITDDLQLYTISINDLICEKQTYFGDINCHSYTMGQYTFVVDYQIEPIVHVNGDVYFITDAYEQNVICDSDLKEMSKFFPYNSIYPTRDNATNLERKYQERQFIYN